MTYGAEILPVKSEVHDVDVLKIHCSLHLFSLTTSSLRRRLTFTVKDVKDGKR